LRGKTQVICILADPAGDFQERLEAARTLKSDSEGLFWIRFWKGRCRIKQTTFLSSNSATAGILFSFYPAES
jgi:hypothetical protein